MCKDTAHKDNLSTCQPDKVQKRGKMGRWEFGYRSLNGDKVSFLYDEESTSAYSVNAALCPNAARSLLHLWQF